MRTGTHDTNRRNSPIPKFGLVRNLWVAAFAMLVSSQAGAEDDLMKAARRTFKPIPLVVPAMKDNPVTHEKVELGRSCSSIRECRLARPSAAIRVTI